MNEEPAEKIACLIEPYLTREKLSLYEAEVLQSGGKKLIRIFIDREEGITHDDCASLSRHLSTLLEVEEIIQSPYVLEVSSPGLTRALKKPLHFRKSLGRTAKISFRKSFGEPKQIIGRLEAGEGDSFLISRSSDGKKFGFSFSDVSKARLEFEE